MSELEQKILDLGIIDLGWAKFTIKFGPPHQENNVDSTYGECDFDLHTITIASGQNDTNLKETLIHEIIHGIQCLFGLNEEKLKHSEEQRCNLMSKGLMVLFTLNPKLKEIL